MKRASKPWGGGQLGSSKVLLPVAAIVAGVGALGACAWNIVKTRRLIR